MSILYHCLCFINSSLNLGGPFIVGHLPEKLNYIYDGASYSNLHFCVRELVINGRLQDFSNALETVELSPSCELTCSSDLCKNGGRCIGSQSSFICVCPVEYAGTTCSESKYCSMYIHERNRYTLKKINGVHSGTSDKDTE